MIRSPTLRVLRAAACSGFATMLVATPARADEGGVSFWAPGQFGSFSAMLYHDLPVESLRAPAEAFLIVALLVFLAPLLVFAGPLLAAKKRAELEYGALVGEHGDFVRKRWILHQPVADGGLLA